jgi:hypothetical protein
MVPWMKRRIHRSRARCQRNLMVHQKRAAERNKSNLKPDRQASATSRVRLIL